MSATLLAAVALILLMACLNLASMYAARAGARGRELAIRAALGAGRGRILRQLMTECLMLAGAGGVLGVVTGVWVLRAVGLVDDAPLYVREAMRIDAGLFGYAFVLCLIAAVVFGLGPAVLAARASGDLVLRQRPSASPATRRPARLSSALVIAELAVGVPLLVAMSLVLRSLTGLMSADPGFQVDQLITMRIDLPALSLQLGRGPGRLRAGGPRSAARDAGNNVRRRRVRVSDRRAGVVPRSGEDRGEPDCGPRRGRFGRLHDRDPGIR